MAKKAKQDGYVAEVGLTLADGTRIEAGEPVPAAVVKKAGWLVEHGHVSGAAPAEEPKEQEATDAPADGEATPEPEQADEAAEPAEDAAQTADDSKPEGA